MQDDVDQAVVIIERFQEIPETAIPTAVMREAEAGDPHHHQSWIYHQWQRRDRDSLRESKRAGAVLRQSVREE